MISEVSGKVLQVWIPYLPYCHIDIDNTLVINMTQYHDHKTILKLIFKYSNKYCVYFDIRSVYKFYYFV